MVMRTMSIVLFLWINLIAGCKKEPLFDEYGNAGSFSMTLEDGTTANGKFRMGYVNWDKGPCRDTCLYLTFSFSRKIDNKWISKVFDVSYIPLRSGLFKFSKMTSFQREEMDLYSLNFYPIDPAVNPMNAEAWEAVYVALEDEFNEFEITHLDKVTGKVEGRFQANLKRYPRVYLRSGGWPPDFVVDTFQTTGSFSGRIWK